MATIDKIYYCKPGAEILYAEVQVGLERNLFGQKDKDYNAINKRRIRVAIERLSNIFAQSFAKKLADSSEKQIYNLFTNNKIDDGNLRMSIPEQALRDLISVCELKFFCQGKRFECHDIDTKESSTLNKRSI